MLKEKNNIEGLFFCHLTIEKILKALVVKNTTQLAPKTHNLNYLIEVSGIDVSEENNLFMSVLMKYQLEGRYPDYYPKAPLFDLLMTIFVKLKSYWNVSGRCYKHCSCLFSNIETSWYSY